MSNHHHIVRQTISTGAVRLHPGMARFGNKACAESVASVMNQNAITEDTGYLHWVEICGKRDLQMNITAAHILARDMMDSHGLTHIPFEFDRGRRRMGACHWYSTGRVQKITISKHYAELLSKDEITEIILHEIAHAISPYESGHDHIWRANARRIGATGARCPVPSERPVGAWQWHCETCGRESEHGQHRAPLRVQACTECCRGKFQSAYILKWFKNGTSVPLSQMPRKYQTEMHYIKAGM